MAAKQKQTPKTVGQPRVKAPMEQKQTTATLPPAGKTLADHWYILILVAIAFLVNATTIGYNYTLDDPYFTTGNPLVMKGISSIPEFFTHAAYYGVFKYHDASYRPLMLISFAIEKQLVGSFNPAVSHFINLLIFCLQVSALFKLLRAIFNKYSVYIPFFIVLLFELHPIHTEVIASVKSRDELMAMLFCCLFTLQSIKYIDTNKVIHLVLSGVWFFCALMSKETPICFVAIVPMTIYFFRDAKPKSILIACAPYMIVAAAYMLMRATFIESDGEKVTIMVNNNGLMAATNYADKLATALFIQLKYITLLIFPHPLSYDYSYNQIPIISLSDPKALLSLVVLVGLFIYSVMKLKTKNVFAYSILFYFALVALTSNIIVTIGATMAERFLYTASLGYCIAFVFIIMKLFKSVNLSYANASKVFFVIAGVAVLYSAKTIARNGAWKSNSALYARDIEAAPNSWRANNLLAVDYTKQLQAEVDPQKKNDLFKKAIFHFGRSIEILPTPDVYLLKGLAYDVAGGHIDSAIFCYKVVLNTDPYNHQALNNLGNILLQKTDFAGAIDILGKAVAHDSTQTDVLGNLAAAYGNSGHFPEAIKYYQMALRINPNQPPNVFTSLTNIYRIMGDSAKSQYYHQLLVQSQQKK
jgi:hypothetical protein